MTRDYTITGLTAGVTYHLNGTAYNTAGLESDLSADIVRVAMSDSEAGLDALAVHRFWSPVYNGHFFTISDAERNQISSTWSDIWQYESVAWLAHADVASGTSPVYRFWSPVYRRHFFTISVGERDRIMANWPDIWDYEGVAWHAYQSDGAGRSAIYRFWSPVNRGHFYTISAGERDHIIATWPDIWRYEGVAYYAYPAASGPVTASMADHVAEEPMTAVNTDTVELAKLRLDARQAEAVEEPSHSDSEAHVVASAPDVLVELVSDGVYFPLHYKDTVVTAAIYDPDLDAWEQVLAATWEPAGVSVAGGLTNRQWLIVLTYDAAAETWVVQNGSWFGRLPQPASDDPDVPLADDLPVEIGLPVETIFMPEGSWESRLLVYDPAADAYIETVQALQGGARYEWTVPQWNRWYRVDIVREWDGTILQSQWIGHHATHTYDSMYD